MYFGSSVQIFQYRRSKRWNRQPCFWVTSYLRKSTLIILRKSRWTYLKESENFISVNTVSDFIRWRSMIFSFLLMMTYGRPFHNFQDTSIFPFDTKERYRILSLEYKSNCNRWIENRHVESNTRIEISMAGESPFIRLKGLPIKSESALSTGYCLHDEPSKWSIRPFKPCTSLSPRGSSRHRARINRQNFVVNR